MAKITLEVINDEDIDREYYGIINVAQIIHMSKANGDINLVLAKLKARFKKSFALVSKYLIVEKRIKNAEISVNELKSKIAIRRCKLTKARKALREFKSAKEAKALTDDILDIQVKQQRDLEHDIKVDRQLFNALDNQLDKESETEIMCVILLKIMPFEQSKSDKPTITLQNILNSALGSTALYDALIEDGWTVDDPFTNCINHLVNEPQYTNDDVLFTSLENIDVYYSKHNK